MKNSLASMLTGWRKRLNDPTAPTWQNCLIPHEFAGFRLERRQKYLGEVVEKNETTES